MKLNTNQISKNRFAKICQKVIYELFKYKNLEIDF